MINVDRSTENKLRFAMPYEYYSICPYINYKWIDLNKQKWSIDSSCIQE